MIRCMYCTDRGFVAYMELVKIIGVNKYYQCKVCKNTKIRKEDTDA